MGKYPYRVMSVYGSREAEPTLLGGLRALTTGETSGHITTDEYFTDPKLYDKYIKGTDIPCRIFKDKETGETVYQVHFSYGPASSDRLHPGSVLDKDEYVNGLNAHYLTPSQKMDIIDQQKKSVKSPIDMLGFTHSQILLGPQSIIKTTPENASAVLVFQENLQQALHTFLDNKGDKDKALETYQNAFKVEFEKLRIAIAPNSTPDQFAHDFHEFGTIGIEPLETRKLMLITAEQQAAGMEGSRIDLRLAKIREIHDAHEDYNLITNNCAHKAAAVERAGVSECKNSHVRNAFDHTVGYNEFNKFTLLRPEGIAGAAMFADPILGRHLETPVNVLRNSDALKHLLEPRLKRPRTYELQPRLPNSKKHHKSGGLTSHLSLHMRHVTPLTQIIKKAEELKFAVEAFIDKNTKKPFAIVDLNPNNPNAIDIKFGSLPLDNSETMALLRLINKKIEVSKDSRHPAEFTIGFSGKLAAAQAGALENDVKAVFGPNSNVTIEKEEPAVQPKFERGSPP